MPEVDESAAEVDESASEVDESGKYPERDIDMAFMSRDDVLAAVDELDAALAVAINDLRVRLSL